MLSRDRLVELLRLAIDRDQEAFAEIVQHYRVYLHKTIFNIVQHQQDAEDLQQEVWLKVWTLLPAVFSDGGNFTNWISKIAQNASLDLLRKRRRGLNRQGDPIAWEPDFHDGLRIGPSAEVEACRQETQREVMETVAELAPRRRVVVFHCCLHGEPFPEHSRRVGSALSTTKYLALTGKQEFRHRWNTKHGGRG